MDNTACYVQFPAWYCGLLWTKNVAPPRQQSLECNASDKPISVSRPVAVLGNLQCKGGEETCLASAKRESVFHLAKRGHFASGDDAIRVDDFVTSMLIGLLIGIAEFLERKRITNDVYPLTKPSDGFAVTEPM